MFGANGGAMNSVVVSHDKDVLLSAPKNSIAVQVYHKDAFKINGISCAGSPIPTEIRRLGAIVSPVALDFLTIAIGVVAADTFVKRRNAADGWTRMIDLRIAVNDPQKWEAVRNIFEKALRFLSGDIWNLKFHAGGFQPPLPMKRKRKTRLIECAGRDCVCLFSGGLDSAIGAIDLLGEGRKPIFVSHGYQGDRKAQRRILPLLDGEFSQFSTIIYPRWGKDPEDTEISMRTRSLSFLAFAAIAASALKITNGQDSVEIFVPENGLISLNIPLTPRRIGSLSTRTTHPYFISLIQNIMDNVGLGVQLSNRYQFKTKGEMIKECINVPALNKIIDHTVSCGKWKRKHKPCGQCVPCIIRRAALFNSGIKDTDVYDNLHTVMSNEDGRDDLISISAAVKRSKDFPNSVNILGNGPLPDHSVHDFKDTYLRGLAEVENFLKSEKILAC